MPITITLFDARKAFMKKKSATFETLRVVYTIKKLLFKKERCKEMHIVNRKPPRQGL